MSAVGKTAAARWRRGTGARNLLLVSAAALAVFGLVMVYSASSVADYVKLGDSAFHLKRQLQWLVLGAVALFVLDRFDYRRLRGLAWGFWGVSLIGLVLVPFFGMEAHGAKRWIGVGGLSIQPSEYTKLACVLVFALVMTEWRLGRMPWKDAVGRLLFAALPVILLVFAQPDMGTAAAIAVALFMVLVLGGLDARHLIGVFVVGVGLAAVGMLAVPFRAARFFSFLDPWADPRGDGYQTIQALLAFGSGGAGGVGLGLSRQKFFYLPAAHTDFVFAIVGEELGLVGTLGVIAAFGVLAYAGFRIAADAKDPFGRVLAGGVTAMIVTQAVMNMAAVTKLMPVTGIPLPLVSSGGSSLTFTLGCVGVILSVSRFGARLASVRPGAVEPPKGGDGGAVPPERWRNGRSRVSGAGGRGRVARRGA